jgi:phytanoyl-CoA hydroxylase
MSLEEEKKFYQENGYLVLDKAISDSTCDHFLNLFKQHSVKNNNTAWTELVQIHRDIPEVLNLIRDPKIVESVHNVLGGNCVALQTVCSFKKFGTRSAQYAWNAHQDNSYINCKIDTYVSGDIALDDHQKDSGVLYVYPGSHKEELLKFEPHKSFDLPDNENPGNKVVNIPKKYQKVDLYLKKGDVLMFHPLVIHGSYSNNSSDKWRPILLMNYVKKGSSYFEGQRAKRTWIELNKESSQGITTS